MISPVQIGGNSELIQTDMRRCRKSLAASFVHQSSMRPPSPMVELAETSARGICGGRGEG
jgi:hypothetical protein